MTSPRPPRLAARKLRAVFAVALAAALVTQAGCFGGGGGSGGASSASPGSGGAAGGGATSAGGSGAPLPVADGSGSSSTPAPGPGETPPPVPQSASLRVSAGSGLFILDPQLASEPLVQGSVEVVVDGKAPPADTTVEVNGVRLVRDARDDDGSRFWHVDPDGTQPRPDVAGVLTVTARSGSLAGSIAMQCPADLAISPSVPLGTPLSGASSLVLRWDGGLPENAVATYAGASLRGYDPVTGALEPGVLSHHRLGAGAVDASLPVAASTSGGYLAELRWPGAAARSGSGDGFCGRAKRLAWAR
jgi:hypothetical protein